ncbi:hypothetical protein D9M70_583070 [compost metagenome]
MKAIYHTFGIRETGLVKIMTPPVVLGPIRPVLHHIVYGYPAFSELPGHVFQLFLGFVSFPALPVTERPAGQHRGLPGECAIAFDHFIPVSSGNEIIVYPVTGLRVKREGILQVIGNGALPFQPQVGLGAVG